MQALRSMTRVSINEATSNSRSIYLWQCDTEECPEISGDQLCLSDEGQGVVEQELGKTQWVGESFYCIGLTSS